MKIYLFLSDRIVDFSLPQDVSGSFSFDSVLSEESKLINIEADNGRWVLYSTEFSHIMDNGTIVNKVILDKDSFFVINRDEMNYLIYVTRSVDYSFNMYEYGSDINLVIGNTSECNIKYQVNYISGVYANIHYQNNRLVIEKKDIKNIIYLDNNIIKKQTSLIPVGSTINIYGLKIIFMSGFVMINNPLNSVLISMTDAKINKYIYPEQGKNEKIDFKDVDLYQEGSYYSKSPRIRRTIETKEIKLSPPPKQDTNSELPLILTIGPMLTMGITSMTTLITTVSKINSGETTIKDSWASLLTSGAMMLSMILWPLITKFYNKRLKERKNKEIREKYGVYLNEKRDELSKERKLQGEILLENLITVQQCLSIIKSQGFNFWDKRVDQDDFLVTRIGIGNELLDVKVNYPEEGFTVEEDDLKKDADKMVSEFKYIENVPISYSFKENKVTAIMGNASKSHSFIDNIIVQLICFYTYEDVKLVIFTNDINKHNWEYVKYLNHNFNNERNFRFFASDNDSAKSISDYLGVEVSNRINSKNEFPKPHYIVIIDDYDMVKRYDFVNDIAESDGNIGFSIIILEERLSKLPSKCNNFISLGINRQGGVLKNSYDKQEQILFQDEIVENIPMMDISKILSNIPIEFEEGLKNLPDSISFMEMERVGKVEQLNILNRWNSNDSTTSLKAEVGVDDQGNLMFLDLHEKYHGPHGLIAGTTGSGKSEFIITYILSMCINYSPDDIAFILIDYKGGGLALAFENKTTGVKLPHLAGTITNLDKAEMDRTLVSIDSEVKRRQAMFNLARDTLGESTIDIYKYQRLYKEGKLKEAIPHLFIICDEFAELKSQQPDFMDNLISVARIGRSLGVHLILATQKPSGVVNDQIWSNSKFKVCLKVQDEADSKEMLKKPDAAHIKQTGRFYLQVGYDEYYALGQSGWCGAKYYPSETIVKQVDKSVNFINDCGQIIKSIQASNGLKIQPQGEQISAIMKSIIEIAGKTNQKAKTLWLENIPEIIVESDLRKKYNIEVNSYDVEAILGEYDAPELQEQGVVRYNLLEQGNTIIYGNDGGEREFFINTMVYSIANCYSPDEINFYVIDYGSESLRRYQALPQFGGMVFNGEDDRYQNLIKMIRTEEQRRKKLFVDYGGEYSQYIKNSQSKMPIICVIINNYDSYYESNPTAYDVLPDLVRDSERYGIIFIITCNQTNSVNSKITSNFENFYAFKLKDSTDYGMIFGTRTKIMPMETEGRGVLDNNGIHEFQTASITDDKENLNDYLIDFVNNQKKKYDTKAKRIPALPNIVDFKEVQDEIVNLGHIPIGISKNSLEVLIYDFISNGGTIISSNKLVNTEKFIKSLLMIFHMIPNTSLFIFDVMKSLNLDNNMFSNYFTDNFDDILDKLNELLKKYIEDKSSMQGIVVFYGLDKLISKLSDKKKLDLFTKNIKKYENIGVIALDEANKLKNYSYEEWYKSLYSNTDGIWIGKGINEQNVIKISNITREMTRELKNDMGYLIMESTPNLCRFIDFITKESDDNI